MQGVFSGVVGALFAALVLLSAQAPGVAAPGTSAKTADGHRVDRVDRVPRGVFSPDDRGFVPSWYAKEAAGVGALLSRVERSKCSAFCVGDRLIASAAHCLLRNLAKRQAAGTLPAETGPAETGPTETGPADTVLTDMARSFTFVLQNPVATAKIKIGAIGTTVLAGRAPINTVDDWLLAELSAPVCRGRVLNIGGDSGRPLALIGHQQDRRNGLSFAANCDGSLHRLGTKAASITGQFLQPQDLVFHDCDAAGHASGAPLFAVGAGQSLTVVGIHSGSFQRVFRDRRTGRAFQAAINVASGLRAWRPALDALLTAAR
ncbi:MAG: hypothetical protein AAFO79_01035 [Pseudomonadota bacterium]